MQDVTLHHKLTYQEEEFKKKEMNNCCDWRSVYQRFGLRKRLYAHPEPMFDGYKCSCTAFTETIKSIKQVFMCTEMH